MSDNAAETPVEAVPVEPAADAAEFEDLQAEIERLKSENASLKSSATKTSSRTGWALVIALVAALVFAIAVPAVWMNRVVMDTDAWVATVAPLASDPAIQDAVATLASDRIIEALDAQTRLEAILPQQLMPIAPLLASSAEDFVRTQTSKLVHSDQFAQLWTELNRTGHKALIAALTGSRDGAIIYEPGVLTLDVGVLAEQVQAKLVDAGLPFLGRVPVDKINKQVEIFNSPALAQASVALGMMNQIALLLPLLALLLSAAAFALALDRRKVALWLGAGITIAGLLPLQAIYLSQFYVADKLQQLAGLPTAAAQNAYNIIFAQLIASERVLIVFGIVIFVGAIIAGPAKWAIALRGGMAGGIAGVASHLELGRFGVWVAARKKGLRAAGIIAAVLILLALPAPRTISQVVWLAVGVIVWYVIVEVLGAGTATLPATDATLVVVEDAPLADDAPGVEEPSDVTADVTAESPAEDSSDDAV